MVPFSKMIRLWREADSQTNRWPSDAPDQSTQSFRHSCRSLSLRSIRNHYRGLKHSFFDILQLFKRNVASFLSRMMKTLSPASFTMDRFCLLHFHLSDWVMGVKYLVLFLPKLHDWLHVWFFTKNRDSQAGLKHEGCSPMHLTSPPCLLNILGNHLDFDRL